MKSSPVLLRFGDFSLDSANRRLMRDGNPIDIGGRYLDALVMLARQPGQLVSKDQLHEEVWRGVPVTDEALSQAIMALRRALGDDATRPRYIETVPRHGYRFIGDIFETPASPVATRDAVDERLCLVGGGVAGAAAAGLAVGLVYGGLAAGRGPGSALSLVLVLISVSVLAALVSGLGIAGGIGLLHRVDRSEWWRPIVGAMLGGLVIGGFARLLGLDTLRLLVGTAPDRITGAGEGMVMGFAVGIACWLSRYRRGPARLATGVLVGAIAGFAVSLAGGTLMIGSLAALVAKFPTATLSLTWASNPNWLLLAGAFEGAVFTALVVAGMAVPRR